MIAYRRRPSPLHSARAGCGAAFCLALASVALVFEHPLVVGAAGLAVLVAARQAGVGREVTGAARLAVPLGLAIALINPLVSREGATVLARLGEVPVLGRLDITAEAVAYGGALGLRVAVVILCSALYTAAVDPDEVLRLLRRFGFTSALTASLATRLMPVLARDGRRVADAQRTRRGAAPSRLALLRSVTAGALDRSLDVAATLELRGYGQPAPRAAARRRPWSRRDVGFAAAALALLVLATVARGAGVAAFDPFPRLELGWGSSEWALASGVAVLALLPGLKRRGTR